jgi:uncharacterized protein (DUF952 family)
MILHICTKEAWEYAVEIGSYKGDTLASQGFIHCSTPEQVVEVADYIFKGKSGLILLVIDDQKVIQEIKYEDAGNGKLYPHIYGPLNTDAVIKIVDFPAKKDGTFELPDLGK